MQTDFKKNAYKLTNLILKRVPPAKREARSIAAVHMIFIIVEVQQMFMLRCLLYVAFNEMELTI